MVLPESDTASCSQKEGYVIPPPCDNPQAALIAGFGDLKLSGEKSDDILEGIDGGKKERDLESDSPKKETEGKAAELRYPLRPGQPDCSFYLRYGSCRFGIKCKFNHPHPPKKKNDNKVNNKKKKIHGFKRNSK
jgi:Zinc finger C-x8-C-x5-C-x3-H type (and similar)